MNTASMITIVDRCLSLDSHASRIYQLIARSSVPADMRGFWQQIADRNEAHVLYWNQLRTWAAGGLLTAIFEHPDKTAAELARLDQKVRQLAMRCERINGLEEAFALAFKLEFYLLHPAFETLFQYYRTLSEDTSLPVSYDRHVNTLFEALYANDLVTLELELLGETLHRLWQENRKMAILSSTDELTGILNRRGLFNAMGHLAHLAQRNRNTVGMLMVDIDHFKRINDAHGHLKGDQVLQHVAATIKENIRASDVLGRYGGEEFLIFLSMVDAAALNDVGEKIRASVADGKHRPAVTVSIGAVAGTMPKNVEQGLQVMLQVADQNLYRAKQAGRNTISVKTLPDGLQAPKQ